MVSLSEVYDALREQDARLFVYDIGFSAAATIEQDGKYAVFYDPAAVRTTAALKECLAHECGHCATGATHRVASPWDLVEKHEYKANRWAIERFLPYAALCRAMRAGLTEPWQLAEWFDVPQSFIERAVAYYQEARGLRFSPEAPDTSAACEFPGLGA